MAASVEVLGKGQIGEDGAVATAPATAGAVAASAGRRARACNAAACVAPTGRDGLVGPALDRKHSRQHASNY